MITVPVLFLHGFTGDGAAWRPVLDRLPRFEHALRPTLLGHRPGRDDRKITGFTAEVDRLATFLDAAGLDDAVSDRVLLVGYSLGARLALGLLARHPSRFAAAILIGGRPGPPADEAVRLARAAADEALATMLEQDGLEAFVDHWQALPLFATQHALPATVLDAQRQSRLAHDPRGLAHALRVLGLAAMPDYRAALPAITGPIRLMAGARDPDFCQAAREMADRLPRATLDIVAKAGHNLILEAPHAVAAAIEEELDRCLT